jgi:hypothetical protein
VAAHGGIPCRHFPVQAAADRGGGGPCARPIVLHGAADKPLFPAPPVGARTRAAKFLRRLPKSVIEEDATFSQCLRLSAEQPEN